MRRLLYLFLALAGCASASSQQPGADANGGGSDDSGGGGSDDSGMLPDAGMDMPDAPGPMTVTLTQTTSQTLKDANSIACANSSDGTTRGASYFRVFDLPALGINKDFAVEKITFQVETCTRLSGAGCTSVAAHVGTYSGAVGGGTLNLAARTVLATNATVTIPAIASGTGGTVEAPITGTVPAGQKLIIDIEAPDAANTYSLFMGSNDGGESGFGYILSTACSVTNPTNISAVSADFPAVHLLMSVTGTY